LPSDGTEDHGRGGHQPNEWYGRVGAVSEDPIHELRRAAVTVGIAPGCHGHTPGIDDAVVQSDGEVACPMCADWNEKCGGGGGGGE
jgi:hypothetical protein